ncbi:MAG: hypothetical protein J7623_18570 [Chitinophaga sp.]|uniref:hypothetical protein n=1 Tax=Chitinophaga sp. TaxID=1869181 RepID=UPI001B20DF50|nr:hypothetical protein [Chitinophaga sp.]MBO9730654.1 hypothetical protein [Chitinophaga sp.]
MKRLTLNPVGGYIYAIIAVFLPFLYLYRVTCQWNPFVIRGPLFVAFYALCVGSSVVTLLVSRLCQFPAGGYVPFRGLFIFMLGIGLARLCQGIYHQKPVGYLVGMLIAEVFLWRLGELGYKRER